MSPTTRGPDIKAGTASLEAVTWRRKAEAFEELAEIGVRISIDRSWRRGCRP